MNLQAQEQFYQMMSRLRANSRAASTSKDDVLVTEMINGLIVSKPAKKIEYLSEPAQKIKEPQAEPQVWNLTKEGPLLQQEQQSKAASIPGINKIKVIAEFVNGKHN